MAFFGVRRPVAAFAGSPAGQSGSPAEHLGWGANPAGVLIALTGQRTP
jgi:hypothetical protein